MIGVVIRAISDRIWRLAAAGTLAAVVAVMAAASAAAAPYCAPGIEPAYAFGFKALHDALGPEMGDPLECEHGNPENGDSLQQTARG